jgi:hypothetical protein
VNENNSNFKGDIINICKKLTGTLYYDQESEGESDFKGRMKLKNDPKVENIDSNNVILKGSILCYTDW